MNSHDHPRKPFADKKTGLSEVNAAQQGGDRTGMEAGLILELRLWIIEPNYVNCRQNSFSEHFTV